MAGLNFPLASTILGLKIGFVAITPSLHLFLWPLKGLKCPYL